MKMEAELPVGIAIRAEKATASAQRWEWMLSNRAALVHALALLDTAVAQHWSRSRIETAIDRARGCSPQRRRWLRP